MTSLSQRARELAEQMGGQDHGEEFSFPSMVNLKVIEQALMRERRLAMEEAAKICDKLAEKAFGDTADDAGASYYDALNDAAITVRSAAERERP